MVLFGRIRATRHAAILLDFTENAAEKFDIDRPSTYISGSQSGEGCHHQRSRRRGYHPKTLRQKDWLGKIDALAASFYTLESGSGQGQLPTEGARGIIPVISQVPRTEGSAIICAERVFAPGSLY